MAATNPGPPSWGIWLTAPAIASSVVRMLPIRTTNITGLRICSRGSSLTKESRTAVRSMACVTSGARRTGVGSRTSRRAAVRVRSFMAVELHVLDDRPEGERRNEGECTDQQHRADEQGDEE